MIRLFVTQAHRYTVDGFLGGWAKPLARRVSVVTYESLPRRDCLRGGTFVFTDLERLTVAQRDRAELLAARIDAAGGRILNRPSRVLRRFELLRALNEAGRNPFGAHRVGPTLPPCRFPVFVREEREHSGALTPLLHDRAQLAGAIGRLRRQSRRDANLLIVEYCDTRGPDGVFRKYSAMRVGERIVPRHVLLSRQWVDKVPDIVSDATAREEAAFLGDFPHAADVRATFDLAHIDYGRIDYSIMAGRVVTWEINTNPLIVPAPQECDPHRLAAQSASAGQIADALAGLDRPDVRVGLGPFAPIGSSGRPRDWGSLKSVALSHTPLGRRAIRALRRSMGLAKRRG